jgi:hypothetical protein
MCTNICHSAQIVGSGKAGAGWFPVVKANVGFDHPVHAPFDHALLLDFVNPDLGVGARVAVEMNVASGKALMEQLRVAIEAAEASGVAE